jgi:hypothetical protein
VAATTPAGRPLLLVLLELLEAAPVELVLLLLLELLPQPAATTATQSNPLVATKQRLNTLSLLP